MANARPLRGNTAAFRGGGRVRRLPVRAEQPPRRSARSLVEIERNRLQITTPEGSRRTLDTRWVGFRVRDASAALRFVRELYLECPSGRFGFITPPEDGAIAPRALALPPAPPEAIVLSPTLWETLVDWLRGGGRLGGRTIAELAQLACAATSTFAITIGEVAARVAREMTWESAGPMRSSAVDPRELLRPLEEAARRSPTAADALVAALAARG